MTTITENAIIKKAPAKKAPAKKMSDAEYDLLMKAKRELEESTPTEATLDVEGATLEHAEKLNDVNNDIENLQRVTIAQKQLINSVNEKNDKLQEKLEILDVDSVKIVLPNHTLKNAINKQIEKVNNKLMDSIDDANDVIEMLTGEDVQEALKDIGRVNDLKKTVERLDDNMYRLDDLDDDIESEVQNQLDNCYYVEESDVENMIDDRLEGLVLREELDNDSKLVACQLQELQRKVDSLTHNKLMYRVKSLFNKIISKLSLKKLLSPRSNR